VLELSLDTRRRGCDNLSNGSDARLLAVGEVIREFFTGRFPMKYYIYFDNTGALRRPSAKTNWWKSTAMIRKKLLQMMGEEYGPSGHVGILSFESEKELMEYFEKTGERSSASMSAGRRAVLITF